MSFRPSFLLFTVSASALVLLALSSCGAREPAETSAPTKAAYYQQVEAICGEGVRLFRLTADFDDLVSGGDLTDEATRTEFSQYLADLEEAYGDFAALIASLDRPPRLKRPVESVVAFLKEIEGGYASYRDIWPRASQEWALEGEPSAQTVREIGRVQRKFQALQIEGPSDEEFERTLGSSCWKRIETQFDEELQG